MRTDNHRPAIDVYGDNGVAIVMANDLRQAAGVSILAVAPLRGSLHALDWVAFRRWFSAGREGHLHARLCTCYAVTQGLVDWLVPHNPALATALQNYV